MLENQYPISYVSKRTGLSAHVIRAWERRYKAIAPRRTAKNRRMYADADLQRLLLLRQATDAGHRIGQLAQLPTERLLDLVASEQKTHTPSFSALEPFSPHSESGEYLKGCMEAVISLDSTKLERELMQASVHFSRSAFLQEILSPLMGRIGDLWAAGQVRIVEEHLASVVVRNFLSSLMNPVLSESSPSLISATPVGQIHEFGAMAASIHAASLGWKVHYLGPNLPAEEIASAVQRKNAKAVALSILYKGEELTLFQQLQKLRFAVGNEVAIFAGGSASLFHRDVIQQISAVLVFDLNQFQSELSKLQ